MGDTDETREYLDEDGVCRSVVVTEEDRIMRREMSEALAEVDSIAPGLKD